MRVSLSAVLLINTYPEVRDEAAVPSGSFSSPKCFSLCCHCDPPNDILVFIKKLEK